MNKNEYINQCRLLKSEEKVWKHFPLSCKALFTKLGDLDKVRTFYHLKSKLKIQSHEKM